MTLPNRSQQFSDYCRFSVFARFALMLLFVASSLTSFGGCNKTTQKQEGAIQLVARTVEIACGECQFKLPGNGCDLAIRVDGKAYFVDGSNIDDHGDAHADDGLCNAIRKAKVTGTISSGRFQAKQIELVND